MSRFAFLLILGTLRHAAVFAEGPIGKSPETEGMPPQAVVLDVHGPSQIHPEPKSFTSLAHIIEFIQSQRGDGGHGLPATFYVPAGTPIADPMARLLVNEGVGLYDTALAVIALVEARRLSAAKEILDIYIEGQYDGSPGGVPMELRAFPSSLNGGSFEPFDERARYFFDFTNVHGDWMRWRDQWKFWGAHTGPNAWLAIAAARFIRAARDQGWPEKRLGLYVDLANILGRAMRRLQDPSTGGGVRYGPKGNYHAEGLPDPYDEINTENNLSAYAAFQAIFGVTQDPDYRAAAQSILAWLKAAPVRLPDGQASAGLFDPATATFGMGAVWQNGHWALEPEHPTDAGGTLAIMLLGPETLDRIWGTRTSFRMWQTLLRRAGRSAEFKSVGPRVVLAGLDFTDQYPEEESLITPEWSAQGLFALRNLVAYYSKPSSPVRLSRDEMQSLEHDQSTMTEFLRQHSNAYALGPGLGGRRQGQTGFHWQCPPREVQAMSAILFGLYLESLGNAWGDGFVNQ